ncbi:hypothetical protein J2S53_002106 [Actinopolyspora lacussalsi]|uniref:Uncharacterized protein n=1 Tax=Actinopolyspora righensis TaxID=995060 RepID=A0A1I7AIJ1_9ACTN|nr:hypothetical protein [Actinopolyspora righensis]MDP9642161.1 hypothetical protein [Actinopolyspora lacussalsi]SFT74781.1 hypothetical protein SAMN04487904_10791 [Actinopolyspora righensis]
MQQFEHAARVLGWHGHLVSNVEVLGSRFTAVTRLRPDVHQWRTAHDWPPQAEPSGVHAWAEPDGPEQVPVPAVDLIGVMVRVSKARRATRACGTLLTIAPCAAVLPGDHPYRPWALTELDYYGIGAVTTYRDGPARLVLSPEDRRAEFGTSLFERWLLELLYQRVLRQEFHSTESTSNTTEGGGADFP